MSAPLLTGTTSKSHDRQSSYSRALDCSLTPLKHQSCKTFTPKPSMSSSFLHGRMICMQKCSLQSRFLSMKPGSFGPILLTAWATRTTSSTGFKPLTLKAMPMPQPFLKAPTSSWTTSHYPSNKLNFLPINSKNSLTLLNLQSCKMLTVSTKLHVQADTSLINSFQPHTLPSTRLQANPSKPITQSANQMPLVPIIFLNSPPFTIKFI